MQRVECDVENTVTDGRPSVTVTCTACEHSTTSFGRGEGSIKRCLALLREECPEGEKNFYVEEGT